MVHELITPVIPECSLASLPPPSPGDLLFDIEGDPFAHDGGLEYLLGFVETVPDPATGQPPFHGRWSFSPAEEKKRFEELMEFLMVRLLRHPDMHIYHYAPY
jgi:predicted RecB family nuclease